MKLQDLFRAIHPSTLFGRRPARRGSRHMSQRRRAFISDLEQHLSENLTRADRKDGRQTIATGK